MSDKHVSQEKFCPSVPAKRKEQNVIFAEPASQHLFIGTSKTSSFAKSCSIYVFQEPQGPFFSCQCNATGYVCHKIRSVRMWNVVIVCMLKQWTTYFRIFAYQDCHKVSFHLGGNKGPSRYHKKLAYVRLEHPLRRLWTLGAQYIMYKAAQKILCWQAWKAHHTHMARKMQKMRM